MAGTAVRRRGRQRGQIEPFSRAGDEARHMLETPAGVIPQFAWFRNSRGGWTNGGTVGDGSQRVDRPIAH